MLRIDADWLKQRNACAEDLAAFEKEWPDGVDVTAASVLRAADLDMNLGWFAKKVLSVSDYWSFVIRNDPMWCVYAAEPDFLQPDIWGVYKVARAKILNDILFPSGGQ